VAALVISVLQSPTKAEASYARRREYAAVPGYLGKFETVDIALEAAQARFGVREDGDTGLALETAALGNDLVPRPQLAVSPSLARELVILRTPPRPVNRGPQLVQGPRLVSRADFMAQQSLAPAGATMDFASGWQRYLLAGSTPDSGN